MKIGILKGIAEAVVGVATSNPALIGKGALDVVKSCGGEALEILSGTDWAEVADTNPFW